MNHIETAILSAKTKILRKPVHGNSNKHKEQVKKSYKIDIYNLENHHEDMRNMAAQWYNSWDDNRLVKEVVKMWNTSANYQQLDIKLNNKWFSYVGIIDGWEEKITCETFVCTFKYMIPHFFIPWLEEEERSKKKNIDGMAEMDILNHIKDQKSIALDRIIKELPEYDQNTLKGTLTNMTKKGYLVCKEINNKKFYSISDSIAEDEKGWFVR